MARTCTTCFVEKQDSEFKMVGGDFKYPRGQCIDCRKASARKTAAKIADKSKKIISELGCCVCGATRYEVLEVHHLHGSYKRYGRSQSISSNVHDIESGTAVVLCANDHVLFHAHFGGKNAKFPPQTKESVIQICLLERKKGGL